MALQQNWDAIDPDAEFRFDGPALPDFDPNAMDDEEPEDQSSSNSFLSRVSPPYKLMLANLPRISAQELRNTLENDFKITARIQYEDTSTWCLLHFKDREHCLEAQDLDGRKVSGRTIQLKLSSQEQQLIIRNSNVAIKKGTTPRFARDKQQKGRGTQIRGQTSNKKHNYPVGGSIRKKIVRNNHQSQQQQTPKKNPWEGASKREKSSPSNNRISSSQRRNHDTSNRSSPNDMRNQRNRGGDARFPRGDNNNRDNNRDRDNRRSNGGGVRNTGRGEERFERSWRDNGRDNGRLNDRREDGRRGDSGRDRVESGRDRVESGRDRVESGRDRVESGRDRVESGRDRVESGRDRVESGRDNRNVESSNWRNTGNSDNQSPSIKRRQPYTNRNVVSRDSEGFSTSSKSKPVKSISRDKQIKKKKEEGPKPVMNRFQALLDDDE